VNKGKPFDGGGKGSERNHSWSGRNLDAHKEKRVYWGKVSFGRALVVIRSEEEGNRGRNLSPLIVLQQRGRVIRRAGSRMFVVNALSK